MLDYMELVGGKRKVICDAFSSDEDSKVHNRFELYEDEKLLMIALLNSYDFISYDDKKFKSMKCIEFFYRFIDSGLDSFSVKQIAEFINSSSHQDKKKWSFSIFIDNRIKITYEYEDNYYRLSFGYKILMEVLNKTVIIKGLHTGKLLTISYALLKTYSNQDILQEASQVYIENEVEEYKDEKEDENITIIKEYGTSFKMYRDIYRRLTKGRSLLEVGFLETGNLFKIHEEDKKKIAKKKLFFGDIIEIKYFENGYAVF